MRNLSKNKKKYYDIHSDFAILVVPSKNYGYIFHCFDRAVKAEPLEQKNTSKSQLWHNGRLRVICFYSETLQTSTFRVFEIIYDIITKSFYVNLWKVNNANNGVRGEVETPSIIQLEVLKHLPISF